MSSEILGILRVFFMIEDLFDFRENLKIYYILETCNVENVKLYYKDCKNNKLKSDKTALKSTVNCSTRVFKCYDKRF